MVELIPYEPEHMERIRLQESQEYMVNYLTPELANDVAQMKKVWTGVDGDTVVGCAGFYDFWPGRAMCWALLGTAAAKHMLPITRLVRKKMDESEYQRIEATVDDGFVDGHRWVQLLGFKLETPNGMKKYRPNGGSCYLYARTR